jgi:hypothetical protein
VRDQFRVIRRSFEGDVCSARAEKAKNPKIEAMIARERKVFIGVVLRGLLFPGGPSVRCESFLGQAPNARSDVQHRAEDFSETPEKPSICGGFGRVRG